MVYLRAAGETPSVCPVIQGAIRGFGWLLAFAAGLIGCSSASALDVKGTPSTLMLQVTAYSTGDRTASVSGNVAHLVGYNGVAQDKLAAVIGCRAENRRPGENPLSIGCHIGPGQDDHPATLALDLNGLVPADISFARPNFLIACISLPNTGTVATDWGQSFDDAPIYRASTQKCLKWDLVGHPTFPVYNFAFAPPPNRTVIAFAAIIGLLPLGLIAMWVSYGAFRRSAHDDCAWWRFSMRLIWIRWVVDLAWILLILNDLRDLEIVLLALTDQIGRAACGLGFGLCIAVPVGLVLAHRWAVRCALHRSHRAREMEGFVRLSAWQALALAISLIVLGCVFELPKVSADASDLSLPIALAALWVLVMLGPIWNDAASRTEPPQELLDRVGALAQSVTVRVGAIRILEKLPLFGANANVARGRVINYTRILVERLSKADIDVITYFELGRLELRHIPKLFGLGITVPAAVFACLVYCEENNQFDWAPFLWPPFQLLSLMIQRRMCLARDRWVMKAAPDPARVLQVLAKVARGNHEPLHRPGWQSWLGTHPPVATRIAVMAKAGGVDPVDTVDGARITESPRTDDSFYPLPPYRRSPMRISARIGWTILIIGVSIGAAIGVQSLNGGDRPYLVVGYAMFCLGVLRWFRKLAHNRPSQAAQGPV